MITLKQATTHKGDLWHMTFKNADGTPMRCKTNGQCQTWKRRPGDFRLPVKRGLRDCFAVTQDNAHYWCLPALWAAESKLFEGLTPTPMVLTPRRQVVLGWRP